MKTLKFKTNINCGGCIKAVAPELNLVESIESWHVDTEHPDKWLEVTSRTGDKKAVVEAVKKSGFEIVAVTESSVG